MSLVSSNNAATNLPIDIKPVSLSITNSKPYFSLGIDALKYFSLGIEALISRRAYGWPNPVTWYPWSHVVTRFARRVLCSRTTD